MGKEKDFLGDWEQDWWKSGKTVRVDKGRLNGEDILGRGPSDAVRT